MKKLVLIIALLFALTATAACAGNNSTTGSGSADKTDTLSGDVQTILTELLAATDQALPESDKLPPTFTDPVTNENAQGMLGLSAEQYDEFVQEAYASTAVINASAFEVALIKCKDFETAIKVKSLVSTGFDPMKWVCVRPDKCVVVDSGSYVLLAASRSAAADAIVASFSAAASNNVGNADFFFDAANDFGIPDAGSDSDGAAPAGNGGLLLDPVLEAK